MESSRLIPQELIDELREAFKFFDTDGNGWINHIFILSLRKVYESCEYFL